MTGKITMDRVSRVSPQNLNASSGVPYAVQGAFSWEVGTSHSPKIDKSDLAYLSGRQDDATRMRERAGQRDPETLPHRCAVGHRWSGSSTAHCGACHRTFSSVGAFDRHRDRTFHCHGPADRGLSPVAGRAYECWGFPAEEVAG